MTMPITNNNSPVNNTMHVSGGAPAQPATSAPTKNTSAANTPTKLAANLRVPAPGNGSQQPLQARKAGVPASKPASTGGGLGLWARLQAAVKDIQEGYQNVKKKSDTVAALAYPKQQPTAGQLQNTENNAGKPAGTAPVNGTTPVDVPANVPATSVERNQRDATLDALAGETNVPAEKAPEEVVGVDTLLENTPSVDVDPLAGVPVADATTGATTGATDSADGTDGSVSQDDSDGEGTGLDSDTVEAAFASDTEKAAPANTAPAKSGARVSWLKSLKQDADDRAANVQSRMERVRKGLAEKGYTTDESHLEKLAGKAAKVSRTASLIATVAVTAGPAFIRAAAGIAGGAVGGIAGMVAGGGVKVVGLFSKKANGGDVTKLMQEGAKAGKALAEWAPQKALDLLGWATNKVFDMTDSALIGFTMGQATVRGTEVRNPDAQS